MAVKSPEGEWAAHLLIPTLCAWTLSASLCPSLRIKEETKETGETREQPEDHWQTLEHASLVHLEAGLAASVRDTVQT